jgi:CBS domain-containing protein/gamma-glutamylcysteine synthetase
MGDQTVKVVQEGAAMQHFTSHLLKDVQALEYMLKNDWFESDITRIGAEQEMCLVYNKTYKPAPINMQVLEHLKDSPWCVTELAKFNLEANMIPREFVGSCLRDMEEETQGYLKKIQGILNGMDARIILTGILPTLRKFDLELHNLTPKDRYFALMEAVNSHLLKNSIELRLDGIDELNISHDSPLLEACNTSFQVHLQVSPANFAQMYNISQTLAAPIISMAANSPLVFGKRLWHESRIALFQQSLDTRASHDHMRERSPRVNFGKGWVRESPLEMYKEDISRFRVLLGGEIEQDAIEEIQAGRVPNLRALQVHNSTVYRWNRACYGISPNGKPHLRIENRVLPAGPTVVDEMANAAFWLGAMVGIADQYGDITKHLSYEDIRDNFDKSAKFGIDTKFSWMKDSKISATDLVKEELLPLARKGLEMQKVDQKDIDKYLGIIEGRCDKQMNGARWMLRTYTKLLQETTSDEAITVMTAAIVKNQEASMPVHTWELPELRDLEEYRPSKMKVEEFMQTDLFTVQKDDIIGLVAEIMDWRKIRYMPVEDSKGNLVGLMTSRLILRHFTRNNALEASPSQYVKDIMIAKPITISPETPIIEALDKMRKNKIGCLPVIKKKELVGIITEMDFLRITGRLLERLENDVE